MRYLSRVSKNREQRPRFLLVLEGAVTEKQYFGAVKRLHRIRATDVQLVPPGPTSPLEIVELAYRLKIRASKTDPYDKVWCVFDVEAKVSQQGRHGVAEALGGIHI